MCEGADRESFIADLRRYEGESFISLGTTSDPSGDTWEGSLEPRDFAEERTPNVMRFEKIVPISDMNPSTLVQTVKKKQTMTGFHCSSPTVHALFSIFQKVSIMHVFHL